MTDLAGRLKRRAAQLRKNEHPHSAGLMEEAADEIERLRAENADLERQRDEALAYVVELEKRAVPEGWNMRALSRPAAKHKLIYIGTERDDGPWLLTLRKGHTSWVTVGKFDTLGQAIAAADEAD